MYWKSLKHYGPFITDDYIFKNLSLIVDKKDVKINEEEEQFIFLYVKYINSKYDDDLFKTNFWNSWNKISNRNIDFKKVNLNNFLKYYNNIKKEKVVIEDKYKYAIIDGEKVELVNYIVEPPGIFLGRGNHPLKGKIKRKIYSKDIVINISQEFSSLFSQDQWKLIIHDKNKYWLSAWQHPVTKKVIYTYPSKKSINRMQKDKEKFNNAKNLDKYIHKIRKKYYSLILEKNNIQKNQIGIIVYFIDLLSIRVGSRDKKNTFGISTLQKKHITFHSNSFITLQFLGKDSILYKNKVKIDKNVYEKLLFYTEQSNDYIFYQTNSNQVNLYLQSLLPFLTSKIFRTYHASKLFQKELYSFDIEHPFDYLYAFKMANIAVAIKCNHRKEKSVKSKSIELLKNKIQNEKNIEKLKVLKKKYKIRKFTSNLNLSTSIANYIDPRIIFVFVKKYNLDIKKYLSKNIIEQIQWANIIDENWIF